MTTPTQPVTCRFFDQDGQPIAAKVSFKLTVQEVYNGIIVGPQPEYVTCDATTGIGVINLFPNALGANSSQYSVKAVDSVSGRVVLEKTLCTVPNSPCYLDLILNQEPFPTIDASGVALLGAQAAAAQATAVLSDSHFVAVYNALSNIIAVASDLTVLNAIAADLTAINAINGDRANIDAVSSALTALNAIYADLAALNSLQADLTNINSVAAALSAINSLATSLSSLNSLASSLMALNAVYADKATIDAVGAALTNVNAVGGSIASINSLAAIGSSISTLSGISSAVSALAAIASNVTTVAGVSGSVSTVASVASSVATVAGISSAVSNVSGIKDNVLAVSGIAGSVTAVAGVSASVSAIAASIGNITAVAGYLSNIAAVASDVTNLNAVAANISALNTAASNISAIQAAPANATNAANSASAAMASQTAASASANSAQAASLSASVSASLAVTAWAASTAPAETLSAVAKLIHSGSVVAGVLYQTDTDTDGGQWRKRVPHASYVQAALGFTGVWRGQIASTSAAWAISGASAGDGFQNTTDGKFYALTGANSATEIFRGNRAEVTQAPIALVETGRLVIYDASQTSVPMWMSFPSTGVIAAIGTIASVRWMQGLLLVGGSTGLAWIDFTQDRIDVITSSGTQTNGNIESRLTSSLSTKSGPSLPNSSVNWIDGVVRSAAAVDPITGLTGLTVYVATLGGVVRIEPDGSSSTTVCSTNYAGVTNIWVDGSYVRATVQAGLVSCAWPIDLALPTGSAGSHLNAFWTIGTYTTFWGTPQLAGATPFAKGARGAFGGGAGLTLFRENPSNNALSMLAMVTKDHSTGWQVGNSQVALCADSAASITDKSVKARTATVGTIVTAAVATGATLRSFKDTAGNITVTLASSAANGHAIWWEQSAGVWHQYVSTISAGGASTATGYIDGVASSSVPITNVAVASGTGLTVLQNVVVANVRVSATAITANQARHAFMTELALMQPGAQGLLGGTSTSVTGLAHDPETDTRSATTSSGVSTFAGLVRSAYSAVQTTTHAAVSARSGGVLTCGTGGAHLTLPAYQLRDEIRRRNDAARALGKETNYLSITSTSGQTIYPAPIGCTINAVFDNAGAYRTTGVFHTISDDGFQQSAVTTAGQTLGNVITLAYNRSAS